MMIDSNAIANLQMLMNTGDGRQAVLAELLQADKLAQSSIGATKDISSNESTRHAISQGDAATVAIQGPRDHCIKLLATSPAATKNHFRLTERIIQQLDRLPKEDKESLITFAEGLAYNYNNQFMAIVGYISIVMFRLHPEHPSYGQLRECEELIHNSALLIRLLVDVFNRSFHAPKTAYPIDLTDIEIGDRIFPNINKQSSSSTIADKELNLQKILKIVASAMAKRMHRIFNLLQSQIGRIFCKQYLGTL